MAKIRGNFQDGFIQIINGKSAPTKTTRHGVNPANLEPKAEVPVATPSDLDEAVAAAKVAFDAWQGVHYEQRRRAVLALTRSDICITHLLLWLPQADYETDAAIEWIRDLAETPLSKDVIEEDENEQIAPALLTGNVIVVKPFDFTPYCGGSKQSFAPESSLFQDPPLIDDTVHPHGRGKQAGEPESTHRERQLRPEAHTYLSSLYFVPAQENKMLGTATKVYEVPSSPLTLSIRSIPTRRGSSHEAKKLRTMSSSLMMPPDDILQATLVFAVLASAAKFTKHAYFTSTARLASQAYAQEAWHTILVEDMGTTGVPKLHIVQSLGILQVAILDFTTGEVSSGWLKIGIAVRICQELQLIKEPDRSLPLAEQEERRRTFWSIYLIDKLVSCGKDRRPAILDKDCHVSLPSDSKGEAWTSNYKLRDLMRWGTVLPKPRSTFTLIILAASALGHCARSVLHDRVENKSCLWTAGPDFAASHDLLLLVESYFNNEVYSVEHALSTFQTADRSIDHQIVESVIMAHTILHLCHCLLNHPFCIQIRLQALGIQAPDIFLHSALQKCREHACILIRTIFDASNAGAHINASFFAYSACFAVTIAEFIHEIEIEKHKKGESRLRLMNATQQSLVILERMAPQWDHAGKMVSAPFGFGSVLDPVQQLMCIPQCQRLENFKDHIKELAPLLDLQSSPGSNKVGNMLYGP
ncbi:uncharacterized protein J7T55_000740 [Diaporthe amygdali]|uniref:uncharacterized protein n=1 Tax=Phomopsis amygdali TaxID=1214568 RepID=UPI0022FEDA24|nr:uncharacterized protein J7T55_000740 [Diaporthe amygdali]KAJ0110307.1 uncharacterized protein J7T55_000740 [Diaporthe amygdali]